MSKWLGEGEMMKSKRYAHSLILVFGVLLSASLWGQDASIKTDLNLPGQNLKWTSSFAFELGQDLKEESPNLVSTVYSGIRVENQNNKNFGVLHLYYDKDLHYTDTSTGVSGDLRDPLLEIGGPLNLVPTNILEGQKLSMQGTLAVSQASLKKDKVSSVALKYSYRLPVKALTLAQYHRITRSFYTKEIANSGSINNPWTYRLANQALYKLNKSFEMSAVVIYDLNRSFQEVLKDGITTEYKLTYYPKENVGIYASLLSLGVSTKEADGTTNQLKFVDEKRPTAYLGMNASF